MSNLTDPKLINIYQSGVDLAYSVAVSGNTVFVANEEAGLQILNVTDLTKIKLISTYPAHGGLAYGVAVSGSVVFVANYNAGLQILNVSDLEHPQLLGSCLVSNGATGVTISGKTAFVAIGAEIQMLDLRTWQLVGNPTPADAGNYHLRLIAIDNIGGFNSILFTIRVEGLPRVNALIPMQYAKVARRFYYDIPFETFVDPNSDSLEFTVSDLPAWLNFNPVAFTFSGTPNAADKGVLSIKIIATDPLGGKAYTDFNVTVTYLPEVLHPLPVLQTIQNRSFTYQIPYDMFNWHGNPVHCKISGDSDIGQAVPQWLHFDNQTMMLSGTPSLENILNLRLLAGDQFENWVSTPLTILVAHDLFPQIQQVISAPSAIVGQSYLFSVPTDTFVNPNKDVIYPDGYPLSYSVQIGEDANWLNFNSDTLTFSGTPKGSDTNVFTVRQLIITMIACDPKSGFTTSTNFNINVGGDSHLVTISKIITPILSILGIFQKRAAILNRVCYKRYQKSARTIQTGRPFSLQLDTPRDSVSNIEVRVRHLPKKGCARFLDCQRFFKPPIHYLQLPYDPLPDGLALPKWIEYKKNENSLQGTLPPDADYRELVVFVRNQDGIVQEQFVLKMEGAISDQKNDDEGSVSVSFKMDLRNTKNQTKTFSLENDVDSNRYTRLN